MTSNFLVIVGKKSTVQAKIRIPDLTKSDTYPLSLDEHCIEQPCRFLPPPPPSSGPSASIFGVTLHGKPVCIALQGKRVHLLAMNKISDHREENSWETLPSLHHAGHTEICTDPDGNLLAFGNNVPREKFVGNKMWNTLPNDLPRGAQVLHNVSGCLPALLYSPRNDPEEANLLGAEWRSRTVVNDPGVTQFGQTAIEKNKIILAGGLSKRKTASTQVYLLDLTSGAWLRCKDLNQPRIEPCVFRDEYRLAVFGGKDNKGAFVLSIEILALSDICNGDAPWRVYNFRQPEGRNFFSDFTGRGDMEVINLSMTDDDDEENRHQNKNNNNVFD